MSKSNANTQTSEKQVSAGHSADLKRDLALLAKALQARPTELRGPFNVNLAVNTRK